MTSDGISLSACNLNPSSSKKTLSNNVAKCVRVKIVHTLSENPASVFSAVLAFTP